ncbi:MAG: hypothetical protein H0V66_14665 [Bdellovibrionales bacterium]|nr:hypothetical protein [Bdellovibrionales bacterium]
MKAFMGILAVLSLMAISTACNRDAQRDDGIQREETIRGDDVRENDNFNRSVPVEEREMTPPAGGETDMGPNESSVTE